MELVCRIPKRRILQLRLVSSALLGVVLVELIGRNHIDWWPQEQVNLVLVVVAFIAFFFVWDLNRIGEKVTPSQGAHQHEG